MGTMTVDVYRKLVRPAAALVAACGVGSCFGLLFDAEPRTTGLDPDLLRYVLTGLLAVFGVALPGLVAALGTWAAPSWWSVAVMFLATTANAVTAGGNVVAFPWTTLLVLSTVVGLAGCTVGLVAVADLRASKPPQSKF